MNEWKLKKKHDILPNRSIVQLFFSNIDLDSANFIWKKKYVQSWLVETNFKCVQQSVCKYIEILRGEEEWKPNMQHKNHMAFGCCYLYSGDRSYSAPHLGHFAFEKGW